MINTGPERTLNPVFRRHKGNGKLVLYSSSWDIFERDDNPQTRKHSFHDKNLNFLKRTNTGNTWSKHTVRWAFYHNPEKNFFQIYLPCKRCNFAAWLTARLRSSRVAKIKLEELEGSFHRLKSSFYSRQKLFNCVRNGTRDRRNVV